MKKYLALCVVALLATVSGFSFVVIESGDDSVVFEYACKSNGNCMAPGEEYCGDGQVSTILCVDQERCEVECEPLVSKGVATKWTATFTVLPAEKVVGRPLTLAVKDTRNSKPVVCDVEIYYGGRWDVTHVSGASHLAGTMAVVTDFTDSKYVNGTLTKSTHTDRQGTLTFTPGKPGLYVLRLLNKYVAFPVSDASGKVYNCSNSICETALGEDKTVCPEDCNQSLIAPPRITCGDGICSVTETSQSCPQDCVAQPACVSEGGSIPVIPNAPSCCANLSPIGCDRPDAGGNCQPGCVGATICAKCGDNTCGPGENKCNCPQDCARGGGMDMTVVILIIIIVAAVAGIGLIFIMESRGPKRPKATAPAAQQAAPGTPKCPNCKADLPQGSAFCQVCGTRV